MGLDFSFQRVLWGGLAGIAGGIVFGAMLQIMGMMSTVGAIIGSTSLLVTWIFHLVNSFVFGAILAALVDVRALGEALAWGLAWGVVLWIIPGTILLRLILDIPFRIDTPLGLSLIGHLLYGGVTGVTYAWLWSRATTEARAPRARPAA